MLKPTEYLKAAEDAISSRSYAGTGNFQLTYALGQVLCRRQSLCGRTMPNFIRFSDADALNSLTSKQWESIFFNMIQYFENHKRPQLPAAQPAAGKFPTDE